MLYLIDPSATDFKGHNLEYLLKLGPETQQPFVIYGNRKLKTSINNTNIKPHFKYETWRFNRFGRLRKRSHLIGSPGSALLLRSNSQRFEIMIRQISALLSRYFSEVFHRYSKVSLHYQSFLKDLNSIKDMRNSSNTLLFSSINARELAAINDWLKQENENNPNVLIILRLAPWTVSSLKDLLASLFDSVLFVSEIIRLPNKNISLFADTRTLAQQFSILSKRKVSEISPIGFSSESKAKSVHIAIPGNPRLETRSPNMMSNLCNSAVEIGQNLESEIYKELIQQSEFLFIPYDSQSYRYRSSGVFAEALTVDSKVIVPSGTTMSRTLNKLLDSKIESLHKKRAYKLTRRKERLVPELEGLYLFRLTAGAECTISISFKMNGETRKTNLSFPLGDLSDCFVVDLVELSKIEIKLHKRIGLDPYLKIEVFDLKEITHGVAILENSRPELVTKLLSLNKGFTDIQTIQMFTPRSIAKSIVSKGTNV